MFAESRFFLIEVYSRSVKNKSFQSEAARMLFTLDPEVLWAKARDN